MFDDDDDDDEWKQTTVEVVQRLPFILGSSSRSTFGLSWRPSCHQQFTNLLVLSSHLRRQQLNKVHERESTKPR